jgi:hypothetical protein
VGLILVGDNKLAIPAQLRYPILSRIKIGRRPGTPTTQLTPLQGSRFLPGLAPWRFPWQ